MEKTIITLKIINDFKKYLTENLKTLPNGKVFKF